MLTALANLVARSKLTRPHEESTVRKIEVELPDGTIAEVDTDDPAQAASAAKKMFANQAPAAAPSPGVANIGRSVLDAATLGLADEARAAGSATGDWLARKLGMAGAPAGSWATLRR